MEIAEVEMRVGSSANGAWSKTYVEITVLERLVVMRDRNPETRVRGKQEGEEKVGGTAESGEVSKDHRGCHSSALTCQKSD